MNKKVLVIEDDKSIAELVEIHLKDLNCEVSLEFDGETGLDNALNKQYDLIVLDLMLPKLSGLEICKELRKKDDYTLEVGADDYLTKPFSIREFIARVKAIFRRIEAIHKETMNEEDISVGDLKIEISKRKVLLDNKRIDLTPKEFDLLHLLAAHPGRTYTREQLLSLLWGYQYNGYEHTVNSHINRLRSKIESDLSNPKYILTSWGVGYRFNESEEL